MADTDILYPCLPCRTIYEVVRLMCGHLPILVARYASKRFPWLTAVIGYLPALEKVASSESPVAALDVRSGKPTTATQGR
jgi:hypothetical protein